MPQLNRADGDDLGASDELIPFKDEGEQEEKRNVSGRDLDDVKSSLVNESETNSGSDSEVKKDKTRDSTLRKQQQDGGLFQPSPYVGYPFFMLPDLGNLCSPYLTANGALAPGGRTVRNLVKAGLKVTLIIDKVPGDEDPDVLRRNLMFFFFLIFRVFTAFCLYLYIDVLSGCLFSCSRLMSDVQQDKEDEKKPHIKKPLNAFMLYMREERPKVVAQCKVKESATINQILGQRWHSLSKEEQSKYYELARKERLVHSKLYPGWSARDNYVRKNKPTPTNAESGFHQLMSAVCSVQGKKKKRKRAKGEAQLEGEIRFTAETPQSFCSQITIK
uniref:Transcription factor 7 like 1a n=1 Tax=Amphiprion percula TaxID=161767 RepID=A0A3P8U8U9_AMPPE